MTTAGSNQLVSGQPRGLFTLFQAHVANRLGVSEDLVREMRLELTEGIHFVKNGVRLLFAPCAVEALASLLHVPGGPVAPPLRMGHYSVVVVKLWPNPGYVAGLVIVPADATGYAPIPADPLLPMVRVRLKTSAHLVRGMVLACRWVKDDLYQCDLLPRRKGRW